MMAPHCPILSTKLKRLVAEQVSFTLSAASLFLCPQILQCVLLKGYGVISIPTLRMAGMRKANHLANDISASSHAICL